MDEETDYSKNGGELPYHEIAMASAFVLKRDEICDRLNKNPQQYQISQPVKHKDGKYTIELTDVIDESRTLLEIPETVKRAGWAFECIRDAKVERNEKTIARPREDLEFAEVRSGKVLKETTSNPYKSDKGFWNVTSVLGGLLFWIPTNIRKNITNIRKDMSCAPNERTNAFLAIFTEPLTLLANAAAYGIPAYYDLGDSQKLLMGAALATNATSGVYELVRHYKRRME